MIGEIYSDNHPCIIDFNSNLVEVYASMQDEGQKKKTVQITEKNLEIAKQFYGDDSLFVLKHHLAAASNKIGQLLITEAQDNISEMRKIVQTFHDNNPAQLKNQYLFLAQILISITLMSTTSSQVAERILSYVMQAQLEYVEFSKNHPFLEQTITNLAILMRTQQKYLESLQLWEWLR